MEGGAGESPVGSTAGAGGGPPAEAKVVNYYYYCHRYFLIIPMINEGSVTYKNTNIFVNLLCTCALYSVVLPFKQFIQTASCM